MHRIALEQPSRDTLSPFPQAPVIEEAVIWTKLRFTFQNPFRPFLRRHLTLPPRFFAFDLLMIDGHDMRTQQLIDRKHELRRLLGLTESSVRSS